MKVLRIFLGFCGLVALGFWGMFGPSYTYRYRLIVEIDTPEGVKSGSSVIETRVRDNGRAWWNLPDMRKLESTTRGEAVFVDLGGSKHVIALLATGPTGQGGLDGIVPDSFGFLPVEEYGRYQSMTGGRMVPPSSQPTMVTFTDLADPASAKVIYATGRHYDCAPPMAVNPNCQPRDLGPIVIDRFAETFGPGYALKGIAIQMTSDPITKGIEGKLPWWGKPLPWLKPLGSGTFVDTRPQDQLRIGPEHFKKGI